MVAKKGFSARDTKAKRPNKLRGSGRRQLTETTIAVLAASGVALVLAIVFAVRVVRAQTRRRFDALLLRVDDQLGSISDSLRDAVERSDEITAGTVAEREPTVDLDAGLERAAQRFLEGGGSADQYDLELEREIARAGATHRPLALVLIAVHELAGPREVGAAATEIAALVGRITRGGDLVVRRSSEEIGVLLPATTMDGGRRFHNRLHEELGASLDPNATVSIGVVEWRSNETSSSFDARARSALDRDGFEPLERSRDALDMPEAR
ncbi:hypothetical protein BH20ACT13_BH20ACT13_16250 [soil metagenome]